jgi:hypothetical protein
MYGEIVTVVSRECPLTDVSAVVLRQRMRCRTRVLFPGFGRCGRTGHRIGRQHNWCDDRGHCGREQYVSQHDTFPLFATPLGPLTPLLLKIDWQPANTTKLAFRRLNSLLMNEPAVAARLFFGLCVNDGLGFYADRFVRVVRRVASDTCAPSKTSSQHTATPGAPIACLRSIRYRSSYVHRRLYTPDVNAPHPHRLATAQRDIEARGQTIGRASLTAAGRPALEGY